MHLRYEGEAGPRPADHLPAPPDERSAPTEATASVGRRSRGWQVAAGVVVALGVAVRFIARSHPWLDEALSINIARLPLSEIPEALRHDGAPPLYYFLLHGWMAAFGTGTIAARALSGVFAVAVLPVMWVAARRLGGPRTAGAAVLLLAASPFAVRYATEARMYSMVVVLALVGWLAFDALWERFSWPRAALLSFTTGLALLTHYWSFYLLAVAAGASLLRVRRGHKRAEATKTLLALGAGCALFLPWASSFLFQMRHTGTPWAGTPSVRALFDTVFQFSGGFWDPGFILGLLWWALIALALLGRAVDGRRIELDLRTRPQGRAVAVAAFGTIAVALAVAVATRSAFAVRYASIAFPFVVLLVALGTAVLADRRVFGAVIVAAVTLGLIAIFPNVIGERTTAARVARVLNASAQPGDIVAYCPDQLGPSVSRELDRDDLVQVTFPLLASPERVDWVDYEERNESASTAAFAAALLDRAGPDRVIWLVWAPNYRTLDTKCTRLVTRLEDARPDMTRMVKVALKYFEHPGLIRYRPTG